MCRSGASFMMWRTMLRCALVAASFGASSPAARALEQAKPKLEQDIVYTKAGDAELKIDVEQPADGAGPFPTVVVLHGGAWRQGSKADVRHLLHEFARRGYTAAAPQYRLCPKNRLSRPGSRREGGRPVDQDQCQDVSGRSRARRSDRVFGRRPSGARCSG